MHLTRFDLSADKYRNTDMFTKVRRTMQPITEERIFRKLQVALHFGECLNWYEKMEIT